MVGIPLPERPRRTPCGRLSSWATPDPTVVCITSTLLGTVSRMTAATPLGTPVVAPPTIGVLGRDWRATVTPGGAVEQWDGLGALDWFVAADDRWHVPAREPAVRQSLVEGTPVVETRLRIPSGDAVHRVYSVADHGGLAVVEITNDSPLPIAVAFAGAAVLSARPPTDMPIEGIDLPAGAVVFPVGHHATLTVALPHHPGSELARSGRLPAGLPTALQVARGWLALAERASRLLVPDPTAIGAVVRERCQLLLDGPADAHERPVDFLLSIGELVRMGSVAEAWMPELADAVAALPAHVADPFLGAALDAAGRVCVAADDPRAERDLHQVRNRLAREHPSANAGPLKAAESVTGLRDVVALERTIADGTDLFPHGIPAPWLGQHFEVYGVPTGTRSSVSFAVRWHGERPAVLWECSGDPVTLTSSGAAPGWSTTDRTGETLWPAPTGAVPTVPSAPERPGAPDGDVSFS